MSRRITPPQYHQMASSRSFEWLGPEVRNTETKTWWRCSKGHEWEIDYGHIREGKGCPYCAGNRPKTIENYHSLAKDRGFEWIGKSLVNVMTKTCWRCNQGHKWEAKYNHIKNGRGCPYCAGRAQKTPEDFHQLAKIKGFTWLGPEVPNTTTKTRWRCDVGHEFRTNYTVLRVSKGKGCPHCSGKAHKIPQDYHNLAARLNSQWIGAPMPSTVFGKTQWLCDKGHEWRSNYHQLDNDHGCSVCSGLTPKTPADYHSLAKSRRFLWMGPEAKNVRTKTSWQCEKGHSWEAVYGNISRTGCPYCALDETQSKGEKRIAEFLVSLNIKFQRQKMFDKCKDKISLRFDFHFMFAGQSFLVEYNGRQHYEPIAHWGGEEALRTSQRRDRIKADFAQTNALHLIIIPYTDFERIGTIIIDKVTEATGESPLEYEGSERESLGEVEVLEGVQLSLL